MIERLKHLRKTLKLTQKDFGKKIGLSGATISDIEKGKANLTDRNIALICEKHKANEEWLRNGVGEMFHNEIHERIRQLRKKENLTQQEFADKISISRSNVGNIEIGRVSVTDRNITDICRIFNINEDWLRFGKAPMYNQISDKTLDNEILNLLSGEDEFIKIFILEYLKLSPETKTNINNFIKKIYTTELSAPSTVDKFEAASNIINETDDENIVNK